MIANTILALDLGKFNSVLFGLPLTLEPKKGTGTDAISLSQMPANYEQVFTVWHWKNENLRRSNIGQPSFIHGHCP